MHTVSTKPKRNSCLEDEHSWFDDHDYVPVDDEECIGTEDHNIYKWPKKRNDDNDEC